MIRPSSLRGWARDVIDAQPAPPRTASMAVAVRCAYLEPSSLQLLLLGGVGAIGLMVFGLAPGPPLVRFAGQAFCGALVIWSIVRPVWVASRMRRILTDAPVATAQVIDVSITDPRDARQTVDSLEHGFATGSWRVRHPVVGDVVAPFATDAPWATELHRGSVVQVLVDRRTAVVLLGVRNLSA